MIKHIAAICLFFCLFPALSHADARQTNTLTKLVEAAIAQTQTSTTYTSRYFNIPYPNGDVPQEFGVCTDVVIRAYRAIGIDLQQRVHEDMKSHFSLYPKLWGLTTTDTNIDHRRVPNLQVFFRRFGKTLPISQNSADYKAGDIVTWNLRDDGGNLPHIGIVTQHQAADDSNRPLIVHNIGAGPKIEDMLFDYKITGHYRYGLAPPL